MRMNLFLRSALVALATICVGCGGPTANQGAAAAQRDALVTVQNPQSVAVATNPGVINQTTLSILGFMTPGQNAAWLAAPTTYDLTSVFALAINALTPGTTLVFPAGTYLFTPATLVAFHDKYTTSMLTAFHITGLNAIGFKGQGMVNFLVGGTAQRCAFYFDGCNDVTFDGIAFNYGVDVASTSISGASVLPFECFYPIALSGCNGVVITNSHFEDCSTAIWADTGYTTANDGSGFPIVNPAYTNYNIQVTTNTFKNNCNYSLITRNATGVLFANNVCDGTGRTWNTSNEDCAFADETSGGTALGNTFLNMHGGVINCPSRITSCLNNGPTLISGNSKNGVGVFVEIFSANNGTIIGNTAITTVETQPLLFTEAGTGGTSIGNNNWTIANNIINGGGNCIYDYMLGITARVGLVVTGNQFLNCYAPSVNSNRSQVVVKGNIFNLNGTAPGNQQIWFTGVGTTFANNNVSNGYLYFTDTNGNWLNAATPTSNWVITGNSFLGNTVTPIANLFTIYSAIGVGSSGHYVQGNLILGGYTQTAVPSP